MIRKIKELFNDDLRLTNKYEKEIKEVIKFEDKLAVATDDELKECTNIFKERLKNGETLEDIKAEAYAVVREAARRTRNEFPFNVQILGALIINGGDIAEMKTGEGKTLTSTMAVYLNALLGLGVHVVTVNEYLSERDAKEMGVIFNFLGLNVGINKSGLTQEEKREAYECDITYTTNSELGFDYLRDNMVLDVNSKVMRGLHFALIDEADSILIDESRTPLIISAPQNADEKQYKEPDALVKSMKQGIDFEIDIKDKLVYLLPDGISKIEKKYNIENIYQPEFSVIIHRIQQALRANYIMQKEVDYLINDKDEIMIIDQFTGRIMEGRAYSDGLHQAIEAKEGVEIRPESKTVATITYQNFFRLYNKLAGMTGTAKTEEDEFLSIYNMRVIPVRTNKPIQRIDKPDSFFGSKEGKYAAIIDEIKTLHKTGQPVLVGTVSVETNEEISELLRKAKIPHEVLNAKNHEREADIIKKAGQVGSVTIATNMAGRGTDIKLSNESKELGGLAVIGTERHESRRIDNQLRGRSGRQGDPGFSRFYVSMEDELMKRFASDFIKEQMKELGDEKIESSIVDKAITSAQKRVEGMNFDIRKKLIEYDDVLRKQRETIYDLRNYILTTDDIRPQIEDMFKRAMYRVVDVCYTNKSLDTEKLTRILTRNRLSHLPIMSKNLELMEKEEIQSELARDCWKNYDIKTEEVKPSIYIIEKNIFLQILDDKWQNHINTMSRLREGIHLRSYAQNDPLQAYINEGFELFEKLIIEIEEVYTVILNNSEIRIERQ